MDDEIVTQAETPHSGPRANVGVHHIKSEHQAVNRALLETWTVADVSKWIEGQGYPDYVVSQRSCEGC